MEQIKTAIHKSWKRREIPSVLVANTNQSYGRVRGRTQLISYQMVPEKQRVIILEVARTSEYTG
eukprot:476249-Hanusia_phi.AAC.1